MIKRGYVYRNDYGEEVEAIFMPYASNPDDVDLEDVETGIEGFVRWTTPFLDREGNEI